MKKLFLLIAVVLFSASFAFGQDVIIKRNGEEISAKILEVNTSNIVYKRFDNIEGPTFLILKSELLMIRYENGTKDIFIGKQRQEKSMEERKKRGHIGISLGMSIPVGKFGSNSLTKNDSGLAKLGAAFDVSFAYRFSENVAAAILLHGQANPVDESTLENASAENVKIDSDPWKVGAYLVGFHFEAPLSKKGFFTFRGMGGLATATVPKMKISQGNHFVKTGSASGSTFGYLFGIGSKTILNKSICLLVNLDFLGGIVDIEVGNRTYSQPINSINFTAGIGFMLK